jgi:cellobiose-specific phosphotransferase system component IIA
MKKLLGIFFLAATLVACDNSGDGVGDIEDSLDSAKNEKVESVREAADDAVNTIEAEHDSLTNKIDSASERLDSINKQ